MSGPMYVGRIVFGPNTPMSELRRVTVQSPVETAHAIAALQGDNARMTSTILRLGQALRVIRDTSSEYSSHVARRALRECGIDDPPEEDHA